MSIGVQPIGGGSVSLSLAAAGLPLHSKLAHLLGLVVSAVIALCVGIVLADGTSVVKLRHPSELPQITARAYWNQGLKYRIDELLGPTYGIGLHHDQSGFVWTEVHAGSTLQELIEDLGVPAVIAAVPSVIETTVRTRFRLCTHPQLLFHTPAPALCSYRLALACARPISPDLNIQISSTRFHSSDATPSRWRASRPAPLASSRRRSPF